MVPVAGRPLLEHILVKLRDHGFTEVLVVVCVHAEQVLHYFGDGARWQMNLSYSVSERPWGTAGELDRLREQLQAEEHFIVHYGDILTNLDTRRLADEHVRHSADLTVGLVTGVRIHTGLVELDAEGRLLSFREKPALPMPTNAGVFALSQRALEFCAPGKDFSADVFPLMIAAGLRTRGFVDRTAYWLDVGRLSDLDEANRLLMGDENREHGPEHGR